ncbi:hypothetical protein MMC18_004608 [Xylographa bjoerkii]|nr:hypothetical protein [Xylographa bjoerkii]
MPDPISEMSVSNPSQDSTTGFLSSAPSALPIWTPATSLCRSSPTHQATYPPPIVKSATTSSLKPCATHPGRFAGFAELPMHEPQEASQELRRTCSGQHDGMKFVGALVDSHTEAGLYCDGPEFDALWAEAVKLDVPIYIHPTWPSEQLYTACKSRHLEEHISLSILAFGFGWHSDVAVHIIRLYAAGVFDRFPRLKIIIGHMGEMIPYMIQRIERVSSQWGNERSFREVWDNNLWLTTSGNWSLDPLACILRNTKHDRIMYSVDYPFSKSPQGLKWLEELEGSGMVTGEELEGIRWKNAAKLLGLNVNLASQVA